MLYGNSPLYLGFASEAWTEESLDQTRDAFTASGCPTAQRGYWWQTPSARGCYHYMACRATAFGANVEVMTRTNCTRPRPSEPPPSDKERGAWGASEERGRWAASEQRGALEVSDEASALPVGGRSAATARPDHPAPQQGAPLSCGQMHRVALVVPDARASAR
eukprot:4320676-Prymnesium_polylepis.1